MEEAAPCSGQAAPLSIQDLLARPSATAEEMAQFGVVPARLTSDSVPAHIVSFFLQWAGLNPAVPYKGHYHAQATPWGGYSVWYRPTVRPPTEGRYKRDHGDYLALTSQNLGLPGVVIMSTASSYILSYTNCLGEPLIRNVTSYKFLHNGIMIIDRRTFGVHTHTFRTVLGGDYLTNFIGPYVLANVSDFEPLVSSVFAPTPAVWRRVTSEVTEVLYKGGEQLVSCELFAINLFHGLETDKEGLAYTVIEPTSLAAFYEF